MQSLRPAGLAILLVIGLGMFATTSWAVAPTAGPGMPAAQAQVVQLGNVKVRGQRALLRVLEAIKTGLQQKFSTNPKLGNVIVCRENLATGSHIMSHLICATNHQRLQYQFKLQLTRDAGMANHNFGSDFNGQVDALNEALLTGAMATSSVRDLDWRINTAGFNRILHELPNPNAPAADMQIGPLAIRGPDQILQTLEAIKLALSATATDALRCRIETSPPNSPESSLVCRANAVPTGQTSHSLAAATQALRARILKFPGQTVEATIYRADFLGLLQNIPLPKQ